MNSSLLSFMKIRLSLKRSESHMSTIFKSLSIMDITFLLRSMLFSFPVHVAAFGTIGVSAKEVIALEGSFLIGSSMSQLIGGVINDAISPRVAYAIGKLLTAIACVTIALFHSNVNLHFIFIIWGAGVGIYDGADFLSAKHKDSNWTSVLRHVETLGIYGSLVSFISGAIIFKWFGFEALFIANAIASLCIPILLFLDKKNNENKKSSNMPQKEKFDISYWLSSAISAPIVAIVGYASATVALKVVIIELQNFLVTKGVDVSWNGFIFITFTILIFFTLRLRHSTIGFLLLPALLGILICWMFNFSGFTYGVSIITLAVIIRTSHKVLFFTTLAEKTSPLTLGRDSSFAQIISGVFLLLSTRIPHVTSTLLLIITTSIAIFSFYKSELRKTK